MTAITCFKAYDLRGRIPAELNDDVAYRVARGYAQFLAPTAGDARLSDARRLAAPPACAATFLRGYMSTAGSASFVPHTADDLEMQLTTMLLEKALYELRYELNTRPDWVGIPLRGILELMTPA